MTLVVDASAAVAAALAADGFAFFAGERLVAPPLLWSESRSALHELLRRREISAADANGARARVERSPIERLDDDRLGDEAWRVAEELGWSKTYDAEYVALARLLECRLVTLDARLRRRAGRVARIVGPTDL